VTSAMSRYPFVARNGELFGSVLQRMEEHHAALQETMLGYRATPYVCWQSTSVHPEATPNASDRFEWFHGEGNASPNANVPAPCTEQQVSDELGLSAALTPRQLHRIRRAFALKNHPDRMAAAFNKVASDRMAIANKLIDKALKSPRAASDRQD
jgi:hypothetical protein